MKNLLLLIFCISIPCSCLCASLDNMQYFGVHVTGSLTVPAHTYGIAVGLCTQDWDQDEPQRNEDFVSEKAFTIKGSWICSDGEAYPISSWRQITPIHNDTETVCSLTNVTIANTSTVLDASTIGGYKCNSDAGPCGESETFGRVILDSSKACHATVADVDFGHIDAGNSVNETLTIQKNGDVIGTVTLTSTDLQSDGTLHLGGQSGLQVKPTDSSEIDSSGHWVSAATQTDIPLRLHADNDVPGGKYSSNLTATLTCE